MEIISVTESFAMWPGILSAKVLTGGGGFVVYFPILDKEKNDVNSKMVCLPATMTLDQSSSCDILSMVFAMEQVSVKWLISHLST